MIRIDKQLDLKFRDFPLGLSIRRLWEHIHLHQVNPFPLITPDTALQPEKYVDIIDASSPVVRLTELTLYDLFIGETADVPLALVKQLLRVVENPVMRKWLDSVTLYLQQFSKQRALRNLPKAFLPENNASPLGVQGLHCALATWLKAHHNEKASIKQWLNRINKLSQRGLRSNEIEFSGVLTYLTITADEINKAPGATITGQDLYEHLNYQNLRFNILPMIHRADNQLKFTKVPANATIKRIKPKLKRSLVTHPQWHDRILGYWVDEVVWHDLLGLQRGWIAFTHRGEPVVSHDNPSGLCTSHYEAWALAATHAKQIFPKISVKGQWSDYSLTGGKEYREWLVTLPNYPPSYFSNHFCHRNVLLHVRCDIREDENSDRILMLQEVQSDWAQQARRAAKTNNSSSTPLPPWLQEWPTLALKLMLLHAVHQGYSAMAWTPGKVQIEPYGFEKTGLLKLYDHTLPTELTKILRPYGRRCETVDIYQPVNFYINPADIGYEVRGDNGDFLGRAPTWEKAKSLLPDGAHEMLETMQGIRLDEPLRNELLKNGFYAWGAGIQ